MEFLLPLIPLIATLPSIFYGDVIDEHRDKKNYRSLSDYKNAGAVTIMFALKDKLYGAWMFNNPIWDRLSLILLHAMTVLMVEVVFGMWTAILWATCPMTVYVTVWRNGRRYNLGNLVSLCMVHAGVFGVMLYPLLFFAHIGSFPALFNYAITDQWWLAGLSAVAFVFYSDRIKHGYRKRAKALPRFLYVFHRSKVILFFKTMAFFVFGALWPRRVFMYEAWLQSYGVDKHSTKAAFKKDAWFYSGILCFALVLAGIWYAPTRAGSWWFLIFFLPFSNLITNHQHNNLRYAVTPAIGLYGALAVVVHPVVLGVLAVCNFCFFVLSMRQFINDYEMYNYHFDHSPKSIAPYFICGQHAVKMRDPAQAETIGRAGLKAAPHHWGILMVLAHLGIPDRQAILDKMEKVLPEQIFKTKRKLNEQLSQLKNLK